MPQQQPKITACDETPAMHDQPSRLTPRQQQILELLKAGKVNKEIATELGIGLGTVKQHMVALFKKLQVTNRTMAVSQGLGQSELTPSSNEPVLVTGILERRPCVVLTVLLPDPPDSTLQAELRQMLTLFALANDCLLLMRKESRLELIFGPLRCSEFDVYKAYLAAKKIATYYPNTSRLLRGAIAAGLAIVSMQRHGGCNGDVIASPVIGLARDLAEAASPGCLHFDTRAQPLWQRCQPGIVYPPTERPFDQLSALPWKPIIDLPPMFGRATVWQQMLNQLQERSIGQRSLVALQGETGLGKSLFCLHLANYQRQQGGLVWHISCFSKELGPHLYVYPSGAPLTVEQLVEDISTHPSNALRLVIIDDCQQLKNDALEHLVRLAETQDNLMLLFAGRRLGNTLTRHAMTIKLERLADQDIERIVQHYHPSVNQDMLSAIVQRAQGTPLFAQALAQQGNIKAGLPLLLQTVIMARLDNLSLDRKILAIIASSEQPLDVEQLARQLNELPITLTALLDKALASGVLTLSAKQFFFTHPLLRQAVVESLVE